MDLDGAISARFAGASGNVSTWSLANDVLCKDGEPLVWLPEVRDVSVGWQVLGTAGRFSDARQRQVRFTTGTGVVVMVFEGRAPTKSYLVLEHAVTDRLRELHPRIKIQSRRKGKDTFFAAIYRVGEAFLIASGVSIVARTLGQDVRGTVIGFGLIIGGIGSAWFAWQRRARLDRWRG